MCQMSIYALGQATCDNTVLFKTQCSFHFKIQTEINLNTYKIVVSIEI